MAKLLKVKAGDKIVYTDCKANKTDFMKNNAKVVIGKIYTVKEDSSGDSYINISSDDKCYANIYRGWSDYGKATKIVTE